MPTPVVTCFLRNRDDVLLLRRSDAVGSYRGRWGAVSGHVAPAPDASPEDRTPLAAARAEVAEETGLLDSCELVRAGDPFTVSDSDRETDWLVHPFLFDCAARQADLNEETAESAWVPPTEILRRETVPDLWRSYDRVRPTVETVAADATHGSAYVSVRALDVLRDRAGELAAAEPSPADAWADLAGLARELLDARPSMAALANRVNRAMTGADDRTAAAVEASAQETIDRALDADAQAAERAAELLAGERVLTLSRSGTARAALERADLAGLVVAESRPGGEGVAVAEDFVARLDCEVTLCPDAAVAHLLSEEAVDHVLVGADTVLADGRVVNKVGTRAAALAADREDVPCHAVAARAKVATRADPILEPADPDDVYDGDAQLTVAAPLFDVTPADLLAGVVTEVGEFDADAVAAVADEHRELADW